MTDSIPLFEQLRRLSESTRAVEPEVVLRQLAEFFQADGIGLTRLGATEPDLAYFTIQPSPRAYPWQRNAKLTARLETALAAEEAHDDSGEWLIAQISDAGESRPCYAWIFRSNGEGWSETDPWLWQCASRLMVRTRSAPGATVDAQAEVQQRLELAAAVTGRLTHDFGNYLTGIMGFTELSLLHIDADSAPHRFLQEVMEAAKQGADWIRRLQLFYRRSPMTGWPTLVSSALAEEETRQQSTGVAGLRWQTELPVDLPLVALDASSLQTALAELIKNAREATKNQGAIQFEARVTELTESNCRELIGAATPGPYVELTVTDDGPGFAPEHHAKLLREVFFSTKQKQRGLGFLVVYGILQRCRGGMRLGKVATGNGATVQLFLPVAQIGTAAPASADAPQLFLVHTDLHLLDSMQRVLEAHGYRVRVAGSAQAALDAFATPHPSFALVICDARSPQFSGLDLARRILDRDPKANFLFLLTSSSFHALAEEVLLKRFPLLPWPTEPRNLLQAIEAALLRGDATPRRG